MSEINLRGWRCDGCGHTWYAKLKPKACAKCKRRNWHRVDEVEEIASRAGETARMLESLANSETKPILVPSDSVRELNRERADMANQAKYGKVKK